MAVYKDKCPRFRIVVVHLAQDFEQAVKLRVLRANLHNLVYLRSNDRPAAYSDLEGFFQNLPCQRIHLFRERRGEKKCLTVGTDVVDDLHNLRLKAHVEHTIGFVQDKVCYTLKVRDATRVCSEQVDHAAWCADNNLGAFLHVGNLVFDW